MNGENGGSKIPYLDSGIVTVNEETKKTHAGKVMVNGEWLTREEFAERRKRGRVKEGRVVTPVGRRQEPVHKKSLAAAVEDQQDSEKDADFGNFKSFLKQWKAASSESDRRMLIYTSPFYHNALSEGLVTANKFFEAYVNGIINDKTAYEILKNVDFYNQTVEKTVDFKEGLEAYFLVCKKIIKETRGLFSVGLDLLKKPKFFKEIEKYLGPAEAYKQLMELNGLIMNGGNGGEWFTKIKLQIDAVKNFAPEGSLRLQIYVDIMEEMAQKRHNEDVVHRSPGQTPAIVLRRPQSLLDAEKLAGDLKEDKTKFMFDWGNLVGRVERNEISTEKAVLDWRKIIEDLRAKRNQGNKVASTTYVNDSLRKEGAGHTVAVKPEERVVQPPILPPNAPTVVTPNLSGKQGGAPSGGTKEKRGVWGGLYEKVFGVRSK